MSLMAHMLSCMLPKSIIIVYNTDSFTIRHPSPEAIADAREITKHKGELENMGKLKIEKNIKIKGLCFSYKSRKDDQFPFMHEKKEIQIYNRDDDINSIKNSFLINAQLAGSG